MGDPRQLSIDLFPFYEDAPADLRALEANCGPLSMWLVAKALGRELDTVTIVRACRFVSGEGLWPLQLALAFRELNFKVEYRGHAVRGPQGELFADAKANGIPLLDPLKLPQLLLLPAISIIGYVDLTGETHFTPALPARDGSVPSKHHRSYTPAQQNMIRQIMGPELWALYGPKEPFAWFFSPRLTRPKQRGSACMKNRAPRFATEAGRRARHIPLLHRCHGGTGTLASLSNSGERFMRFKTLSRCAALVAALTCWITVHAAKEVTDFALLDNKGRYYHLRQSDAKAVVLFFTANGCPIARQSIPRLKALEKRFASEKVSFWMIDSNSGDDRESIGKEAWEFHVGNRIPVLMDETQGVAAMLGVKRTATAVCIETKTWTVFYQGAIDDQLVEGAEKPKPTENYLEAALANFVDGKPVEHPQTTARGCLISFGSKEPVSYTKQVAPILASKCFGCHSPSNIGPIKMTNYHKVEGSADMIQEVLLTRRMPPWHSDREFGSFVNDSSLNLDETRTLLRWVEQGAKQDDGPDPLASATPPSHDWKLGKPDAIVSLPNVEEIPATGVLEYRHIKVVSPFDHDVWVKGIVAKPDNTRVVHHLIVRAKEHANDDNNNQDDAFLIGWAPGTPEMFFPAGTGKLIKKGAILDFEMHYTTSGREEKDQSSIGIYLLDQRPEMVLKTRAAVNYEFEISPGEATENVVATYGVKHDSMLFDMAPHMHLRGAWFKFEALYPNGKKETLLSVPKYDFKWQHNYRLKEPKRLSAGTWIFCSGGFDNSTYNPANPNPKETVRWGEQSFEEMFIGFMGIAEIPPSPSKQLAAQNTK